MGLTTVNDMLVLLVVSVLLVLVVSLARPVARSWKLRVMTRRIDAQVDEALAIGRRWALESAPSDQLGA